jgi:hypothetical protein
MAGLTQKELDELNGPGLTAAELAELSGPAPPAVPPPVVETTRAKVANIIAGRHQMERQFPPLPQTFLGGLEARARGAAQVLSNGSADELIGGARAIAKKATGGLTGDDRPIGEIYRAERDQYQADDDRSQRDEPVSYGQAAAGASLVPWNLAAKIVSPIGRLLAGSGVGMFGGFAGSRADVTKGDWEGGARDTALGGFLGTLGAGPAALGKATRSGKFDKEYRKQITHDLTEGANPIHARRATGDDGASETIVAWVEKNKDARKAIEGKDRQTLKEVAQKDIASLAAKTAPVYPTLDAAAGKVHLNDIDQPIQGHMDELRLSPKQNKPVIAAFEDLRNDLADKMKRHGYEYSHKQVREWVTGLLEQKQQVKGTINETPIAAYKEELHEVADEFLRNRLDDVASKHPQLAPDIKQLRRDNRDLSAAIRVLDVTENADKLANWKGKTFAEKVGGVVTRGVSGALAGGVMGGFAGSMGLGAAGGALAAAASGAVAKGMTKMAVNRLGQLSRAVKEGNATAQMVQDSLDAGVPEQVLRAVAVSGPGLTQNIWNLIDGPWGLVPRQRPAKEK